MKIESVPRKSNKTDKYLFLIFTLIITGLLLNASIRPWGLDTKSLTFWLFCAFSILILLFWLTPFFSEKTIKKITVSPEKIIVEFFKKNTIYFYYHDISKISSNRIKQEVRSGYVSEGFLITCIQLKNGNEIFISEADFENYRELIAAIGVNFKT